MPVAPEDLIAALPCWRGALEISPMPGGLSNSSYKVVDSTGAYVARLGRDFPFHHVSRRREREASRAAHAAGLAPRVAHFGEGVLVLEFIEGRPLTAEDFRARLPEVAALIGRAHAQMGRRVRGEARRVLGLSRHPRLSRRPGSGRGAGRGRAPRGARGYARGRRRFRCRSSSAITICCPAMCSTTGAGSG